MMHQRPLWLILVLLALTAGCKKREAAAPPRIDPVYGEVLAEFQGELTEDDERRHEDGSPADSHNLALKEGDYVHIRMEATTPFRTYLLVSNPDNVGGYRNDDCVPGDLPTSCVRFQAEQTGTYVLIANSATEEDFGEYKLTAYKETEEEFTAREAEHKLAVERIRARMEQQKKDRVEERLLQLVQQYRERKAAVEAQAESAEDPQSPSEASAP